MRITPQNLQPLVPEQNPQPEMVLKVLEAIWFEYAHQLAKNKDLILRLHDVEKNPGSPDSFWKLDAIAAELAELKKKSSEPANKSAEKKPDKVKLKADEPKKTKRPWEMTRYEELRDQYNNQP